MTPPTEDIYWCRSLQPRMLEEAVRTIEDLVAEKAIWMPKEVDLVLDVNEYGGKEVVDYCLTDHEKRVIVFVEEFSSDYLPHRSEIRGVGSGTHLPFGIARVHSICECRSMQTILRHSLMMD